MSSVRVGDGLAIITIISVLYEYLVLEGVKHCFHTQFFCYLDLKLHMH
jgi:hypothetical protein